MKFHIIGGGLAGCEASFQLLSRGHEVILYEMRPHVETKAHKTHQLAELVCSNSLKSMSEASATGELKREMVKLNSLILTAAYHAKVPAGQALAVNREIFSEFIEQKLSSFEQFTLVREEVTSIPSEEVLKNKNEYWIISSGPLTSDNLAKEILKLCDGDQRLYFYDAIAPILEADSINLDECFTADRYDKGDADYINIPLNKEEYENFITEIENAEKVPLHHFESTSYFESCLPIEVMVERGRDTLRFGPLKPVGLKDPKTGRRPWANIQLRKENVEGTMYSMVGFQTKINWNEQKKVFSTLPGLKNVEFFRLGSVHRNTYIESPKVLNKNLSFKKNNHVFLAGQITGVEGYLESSCIGLMTALFAHAQCTSSELVAPPKDSMLGALTHYITYGNMGKYSPMNTNLGLLPPVQRNKNISKNDKKQIQCDHAFASFNVWYEANFTN